MINRIWRFFSSLKLALVLMLVLIGLSLIGTFLLQVPPDYTRDAGQYQYWLENVARPQTGVWFPFLRLLGFFDIFHSVWFLGAGALLMISILICTINRWKATRAAVSLKPPATNSELFISSGSPGIGTSLQPAEAWSKILNILKRSRYTLSVARTEGNAFLSADKNRFSPLGTYLVHLSLVLFIAGFLIGSYLGFRDPSFAVAEGVTKAVGNGTGLSLTLQSFTDEYWENGSPKDYRSLITVLDNGREAATGVVQVNHPLSYKGVRFYQSYFGDTAGLNIEDSQGKSIYDGPVLLSQTIDDYPHRRPAGSLELPPSGYTVFVVGRANTGNDDKLAENQVGFELYQGNSSRPVVAARLTAGEPYQAAGLDIIYTGKGRFSGFQVSRDPGNGLIWTASALFLIGLIVVFYFPRRQLQIMLRSGLESTSTVYIHSGTQRKVIGITETKSIEIQIRDELTTTPERDPSGAGK